MRKLTLARRAGGPGLLAVAAGLSLLLAGCGDSAKDAKGQRGTPEVGFRVMQPATVPLEIELPGRVNALQTAEVRPQISGVIEKRLFTEGALVHAGQPLYRIDASLYRAAAAQAEANVASARASAEAAGAKAERYRTLAEQEAVARQDYADALATARQTKAAIAQTTAALNTARINLRFTTVPAPITGRIGRSLFTEGALVTNGQAGPLAVISQLDTVYFDMQQSAADMLRLRRQLANGGNLPSGVQVRLKLDDGTDYPLPGTLQFSEVTADAATGTVTLRARFPNPQGLLMPGMFARARIAQSSQAGAYLVPQVALTRDAQGKPRVYVVGRDNKAEPRSVAADRTMGDAWVVTGGLSPGDRLITQGIGKLKPNGPVKPVPETAPQGGGERKQR